MTNDSFGLPEIAAAAKLPVEILRYAVRKKFIP